jgi:hypothetical protein
MFPQVNACPFLKRFHYKSCEAHAQILNEKREKEKKVYLRSYCFLREVTYLPISMEAKIIAPPKAATANRSFQAGAHQEQNQTRT